MKAAPLLLGLAFVVSSASAEYFSEGWKPGQPAHGTREAAPPTYTPGAEPPAEANTQPASGGSFDFSKLLTSGPVGSLLTKVGVNLSASLSSPEQLWDPRVPLITDDNYEEIIVNEPLTPEEEERRTWFLVISTAMGQQQQGGLSRLVDEQFDAVFNTTLVENDLPDVRFGRIDYINVTYITTKWNIWQGPWLVVLKDRGQSLRFFNARHVRVNSTVMRTFLKEEGWKHTEPWNSIFAPGGKREFVLHYFALGMKYVYDFLIRIPKLILMIITGALGSVLMRLLHREPAQAKPRPAVARKPKAGPPEAAVQPATSASPSKKSSGKPKKGGKK